MEQVYRLSNHWIKGLGKMTLRIKGRLDIKSDMVNNTKFLSIPNVLPFITKGFIRDFMF